MSVLLFKAAAAAGYHTVIRERPYGTWERTEPPHARIHFGFGRM